MSALKKVAMPTSPEAELVREIEDLIRKLAFGHANNDDLQRLHDLQRQRVELMRPKVFKKRVPA